MEKYENTLFISYAWGGKSEEIVVQIEQSLQKRGLIITRDKHILGYKESIKEFMERLAQGSCIIVVISDTYLRSPNCMYELVEIAENEQFYDRIFPVILADADIYDPVKRLGYIKYWEDKRNELVSAIHSVDPANLQGIRDDIDLYDLIRNKISGLASILKDMNTLTPEIHQDSDFRQLYIAVEKRISGNLESLKTVKKDSKARDFSQKLDKRIATNSGGHDVGNIQIGGDFSGNLIIGNNNSINEK